MNVEHVKINERIKAFISGARDSTNPGRNLSNNRVVDSRIIPAISSSKIAASCCWTRVQGIIKQYRISHSGSRFKREELRTAYLRYKTTVC